MSTPAERELAYYEDLYGGFAQQHFAKPAVAAFRRYLAARILAVCRQHCGATTNWRVLSLGCGIGDTELLIAPHVGEIVAIDLSPKAIAQGRKDAGRAGRGNVRFLAGDWRESMGQYGRFDVVLGVFFFHHLTDSELAEAPRELLASLTPSGAVYALEPSSRRLAGAVGKLVVPRLMKRYQTADERQLVAQETAAIFLNCGFRTTTSWFDFVSTPLAGLLPSWESGYRLCRLLDHALIRMPLLNRWSANFELLAIRDR
jgi:SAM-dependent methyltransferase